MSSYLSPVIQHNDQRIFVKGSIKEKEIDFLLDTGAEITVIPTKLAQGLNIPYKKTKLCLTGVIGEDSVLYETPPIEANGFFSVPLHSDSQPWLAFTVDYEQYHQAVRRDLCDPECPVKSHFWVKKLVQEIDPLHRIERLQSKPYLRLIPLKHSAHF